MKGVYCLVLNLPRRARMRVGSLGQCDFPPGMYAYVGSALGGIEQRVRRHKSTSKRRRWHIDYLLEKASVTGTVAIPGDRKSIECGVAQALLRGDSAAVVAEGFGSSDCGCRSHLIYFGDLDPECVAETISMALAMLQCVYPKDVSR